jgi:hypothetical protein
MSYLDELLAHSVMDDRVRDLHPRRPARRPLRLARVARPVDWQRSLFARLHLAVGR